MTRKAKKSKKQPITLALNLVRRLFCVLPNQKTSQETKIGQHNAEKINESICM